MIARHYVAIWNGWDVGNRTLFVGAFAAGLIVGFEAVLWWLR